MKPVSLDAELVSKLTANGGHVPLTDTSGKPIGHFLSVAAYEDMRKAMYDQAFSEITEEEVEAALADPRRHTTEEVFKLFDEQ